MPTATWRGLPRANTASSGEKSPGWHPALWSLCGSPYSGFTPQRLQKNLQNSSAGNLIVTEKGWGDSNTQHSDLGRPSSHVQSLIGGQISGYAHLQNRVRVQGCPIWVPKQGVFLALEAGLPLHRQKPEPSPTHCRAGPQLHLTERTGENIWKLHNPATLKLRGKQIELISPEAKPGAVFVQGTWGIGQFE